MEWNAARLKFPLLSGVAPVETQSVPPPSRPVPLRQRRPGPALQDRLRPDLAARAAGRWPFSSPCSCSCAVSRCPHGTLPKKKADPITDRARALNAEISALEAKIQKLNQQIQSGQGPRLRSTVYPSGPAGAGQIPRRRRRARRGRADFRGGQQKKLTQPPDPAATPQHFNELGVRKFDLLAVWRSLKKQFAGAPCGQSQADQLSGGGQHPGPASFALREAHSPQTVSFAGGLGRLHLPRIVFVDHSPPRLKPC